MSHHFDTPTAREDSRINVCELYLFLGRPGFTVMAMTVKPDAHHPRQIYFVKKACTHSSSTSTAEPTKGMFIWARLPNIADSFTLAESARSEGSVLAPGAWRRLSTASRTRPGCDSTLRPATTLASCVGSNDNWLKRRTGTSGCPNEMALPESNRLKREKCGMGNLRARSPSRPQ
jgi:hypothetical protein